jgi:DNA-binding CsgD family transcriptional regulator
MNKTDLAFPFADFTQNHQGLTKREYIATALLAGILSNSEKGFILNSSVNNALLMTDELLKKLAE